MVSFYVNSDYYPFGMPMPNRHNVDANKYRYGYQGEFAETDEETGKQSFERRLYDSRIGKWLRPDDIRRSDESPYMAMGNNPILYGDPDGRDIIPLISSNSVTNLGISVGHAAVLIGNDKDGWWYVSKNGTADHGLKGPSHDPDLGDVAYDFETGLGNDFRGSGLTADEVIEIINERDRDGHNDHMPYDIASRISSSPTQDLIALQAAREQARSYYHVTKASCLNVIKDALGSINTGFYGKGLYIAPDNIPNSWISRFNRFNTNNFYFHLFEIEEPSEIVSPRFF